METLDHFEEPYMPTSDEKTMAMLSHILPIIAGFIAPLIIYLVKKDESAYVRKHAAEALNFQITLAIYFIGSFILMFVVIGIFTMIAAGIMAFICAILATIKANEGNFFKYPLTIRLVN